MSAYEDDRIKAADRAIRPILVCITILIVVGVAAAVYNILQRVLG